MLAGIRLSHELLLSIEEYICATRHRTDLWNVRGTWHWSLRWSLCQPNMPSLRGAQLSLIMCHKLLIRGSRVKKHHMGKAFPRKDSETVFCLCLQVYKPLCKWGLMTCVCVCVCVYIYIYIYMKHCTFVLVRRPTLAFFSSLFTYTVYLYTFILKKKASLSLIPDKPCEFGQALRGLKQQKMEWIIIPT